jgi:hypothetical protein
MPPEQTCPVAPQIWLFEQGVTQTPLEHVCPVPQAWPHEPQLLVLVSRFVSQPSPEFELQSPQPVLQDCGMQKPGQAPPKL